MDQMKMDHGSRTGRKCCVEGCPKRFNSMYRFPRSDPELFKVWLEKVKPPFYSAMTYEEIYRKYSVCEDHFPVECKVPGAKRGLTKTAVPTLNIPEPSSELRRSGNRDKSTNLTRVRNRNGPNSNPYLSTCRVCLERSTKLYPLQGPIINCDVELCKMIVYCVGEEIELSDDLPRNVCIACFKTVRICYNFIRQYKANQQSLLTERLQRIKYEQQNALEEIEFVDSYQEDESQFEENPEEPSQFEENVEESLQFEDNSYHNEDTDEIENESRSRYEEQIEIKFEGDHELQEEEDASDEASILFDLIKQDNVEIEEVADHRSPDISSRQIKEDIDTGVQPDSTTENVFKNDHNYVGVLDEETENVKRTEIKNDPLANVTKFIPILPKAPSVQKMLITPVISTNSKQTPKFLRVLPINLDSKVQWVPVTSNAPSVAIGGFNKIKVQTPPEVAVPKKIIVKKELGNAKSSAKRALINVQNTQNFVKKKIIMKKIKTSVKPDADYHQIETSNKTDNSTNEVSRKVILKYPCPVCPNTVFLGREAKFRAHILGNHYDQIFNCNKCSLTELNANLYLEHFLTSHRFECRQCQKTFRNKHNLVTHLRRHLNIRHFCTQPNCKKSFAMPFALKKHLEEHTGQVEYPCKICGHISTTYDTHNYHVRMHAGRKFLCTQCGQTFLQASHLKAHMWKHTGKKHFKCNQCNNSYTSVGPLRKHQRKYHNNVSKIILPKVSSIC